jgi:ABC-type sugar transport system ATPase subunit
VAEVRLVGVTRAFRDGSIAVDAVDLVAPDGEILVLLGPSGSGKSTLLRLTAGLDTPTSGRVWIGGVDVTDLPPQRRDVAMVFQSYALYPHRTVRENLAFGLRMRGVRAPRLEARVAEVAGMLDLEPLLDRVPAQLSGGQRQRVALGRAIVREPAAFLLDEPLSNLDPALRVQTRTELARLQRRLHATLLYVTHDQEEAMTLGDRVAVIRGGRLQQVGTPVDLYQRPTNAFVAGFVGSPAMNLIRCQVSDEGVVLPDRAPMMLAPAPRGARRGSPILMGIRPHDMTLSLQGVDADRDRGGVRGRVERVEMLGADQLVHVIVGPDGPGALTLRAAVRSDRAAAAGDLVTAGLPRERLHWFDAETGHRLQDL